MAEHRALKLRARDEEDVAVISSLLQDALVPVMDMAYLRAEKRFVMVANRFAWDDAGAAGEVPAGAARPMEFAEAPAEDARFEDAAEPPPFRRVNCGVCFDRVERVRVRNLRLDAKDEILNLLAVTAEPGAITLHFSDDKAIRLEVGAVRCRIEDLGEPWPTRWRPSHVID